MNETADSFRWTLRSSRRKRRTTRVHSSRPFWAGFGFLLILFGLSLTGHLDVRLSLSGHASDAALAAPIPASQRPDAASAVDLIVVPAEDESLLAVAVPLAARLRTPVGPPFVLALSAQPSEAAEKLARRMAPRHCLVLGSESGSNPGYLFGDSNVELILLDGNATNCGARLARRFWGKSEQVILASTDDPEGMILGSMLAAHRVVPFIPVKRQESGKDLWPMLWEIGAKRAFVASGQIEMLPKWARILPKGVEVIDTAGVYRELFATLNPASVQNLILARMPEPLLSVGQASWVAPYLSLARGAPVVLVYTEDGTAAERKVLEFVGAHRLRPRSVTILGDSEAIGEIEVTDQDLLDEYEVYVEPCSGREATRTAAFAVGRFPFAELERTSLLVVRGLARERGLADAPPNILMVANPKTEYSQLPFCEVVSRATAAEFRHAGYAIDEYYGEPSNKSEILQAVEQANLILYEGHITDQHIFEDPTIYEEDYGAEEYDYSYEAPGPDTHEPVPASDIGTAAGESEGRNGPRGSWESDPLNPDVIHESPDAAMDSGREWNNLFDGYDGQEFGGDAGPVRPPSPLHGSPLVVVQSCHSLEEWLGDMVFDAGGTGLIGSATNIHSASGSAFVKAFCDGLVYRGDTVGEALRDARNYFLCVRELKARRGHKEQAKVFRAALSFRLWGDPELRVLPPVRQDAAAPRVTARFEGPDQLTVSTPAGRLPTSKNEKYTMRVFPGAEVAGIVKRQADSSARRLLPIYFFRLPTPAGFPTDQYTSLRRKGDKTPRGVVLTDPLQRYVYTLYYPWTERRGTEFALQFEKQSLP